VPQGQAGRADVLPAVARIDGCVALAGQRAAVLLVSELVTNSVRHSASRLPGQTITVTVRSGGEVT
jgi:two-component sensor histidine kinase